MLTLRDSVILEAMSTYSKKSNVFIVHEHHADRAGLHYDLRFRVGSSDELESYASRNFDELVQGKKNIILLIKQPNHELSFLDVTSMTIPPGEFGAGKMVMYDRGKIKLIDADNDYRIIDFSGEKFKGVFSIVPATQSNTYYLIRGNVRKKKDKK